MLSEKLRSIICVVLAAIICFSAAVVTAYAQDNADAPYVLTLYNDQNGLPTGEANTVLQTSDGYIWIGSYGGLIRHSVCTCKNGISRRIFG